MRFTITNAHTAVVVRLLGNLAVGTNLEGLHAAVGGVSDARVRVVFLDLAGVAQLDCGGIGELIRLRERVVAAGRSFGLLNVDERPRQLLEMARLTTVLGVQDAPADARLSAGTAGSPGGLGSHEPPTARAVRVQFPSDGFSGSRRAALAWS